MIHEAIGQIGHLGSIGAFIFAIISFFYYVKSAKNGLVTDLTAGRLGFVLHAFCVTVIVVSLFFIIYNHYYEYHYAWSHSSNSLATHYMISCFWEGQEGSFLLWTFWNVVLSFIILFKKDSWEAHVMAGMMLIQVFLSSMLLGVALGDFKLGSSPFMLLREVFYDAPIYLTNPNHVPEDGTGLNPLLQNYWMVIHPPTLFLGFSLTQVPFVYAIAGLFRKQHLDWIKKSFTWALVCASILGIGIMMGAFWAYETLNFGGYWNWDPVENAVYVPWLIIVALVHTFSLNERKGTAITLSYILAFLGFILILYATFLTRSGILGSASVHSFTDLGLSGQLLIFLLLFFVGVIMLLIAKRKSIPISPEESTIFTREFWITTAVVILGLGAFQVLVATSFPVFNSLGTALGLEVNLAQPADQINFYGKFQIWVGIFIALAASIGQYVWWNKMDYKKSNHVVLIGGFILVGLIIVSFVIINQMDVKDNIIQTTLFKGDEDGQYKYIMRFIRYILLFSTACFSLMVSCMTLYKIRKSIIKLSGGAMAHIGVALMLIGILFSAGYSKVISINEKGKISKEFTTEQNKENVVLWRHTPHVVGDYSLTYSGKFLQPRGTFSYINFQNVLLTDSIGQAIIKYNTKDYAQGDTVYYAEENSFYQVDYESSTESFSIFPRIQRNEAMGGILPSPDVKRFLTSDIYSYVASIPLEEDEWSDTIYKKIYPKDTIFINDYVGKIDSITEAEFVGGINIKTQFPEAKAFTLHISLQGKGGKTHLIRPSVLIESKGWRSFHDVSDDIGASVMITDFPFPGKGDDSFTLAINTSAVDYVILHAERKPLINLVWIGTLLCAFGFIIAMFRRRSLSKLVL